MDASRPNGSSAPAVVTDFTTGMDTVRLDAALMPALGTSGRLAADDARFYAAAGASTGHDADDRIIYNTSTGQLYYDPDGSGAQDSQIIAQLNVPGSPVFPPAPLAATDIEIVNGSSPTPTPTPTPGQNISGTAGNDSIVGGSGNDFLAGNSGDDSIVGGAGNDTIFGDGGNDWIEGGAGNDSVSGGGGQDSIVFREFGAQNADTVANFDTNWDSLRFDGGAFTAMGGAGHFAAGDARFYAAAGAAGGHDADDRLIYNTSTGQLYYDADGAGGADAQLVATLQGAPAVAAGDIWVI
jgi:Ca2+-binding RTX toxin-like protein